MLLTTVPTVAAPAAAVPGARRHPRLSTGSPTRAVAGNVRQGAPLAWVKRRQNNGSIVCRAVADEGDEEKQSSETPADSPDVEVLDENDVTPAEETSQEGSKVSALLEKLQDALDGDAVADEVLAEVLPELKAEAAALEESVGNAQATNVGLEDQVDAMKDQYLRLNADFDNFRKRTEKEKAQLSDTSKAKFVEAMLPVVDNFELAKNNVKAETEEAEKVNSSYQALYKQMMDLLSSQGLTAVEGVGTKFDPAVHEAIMREESAEAEDDTILEEFRKGYMIGDKLIRPAMVKVAVAAAEASADAPADEVKEEA